ncbi:MAG: hypothetical protein IJ407_02710 [Clostridia bacterium]|nr:hypothetical protein [Clostridia bacterium]
MKDKIKALFLNKATLLSALLSGFGAAGLFCIITWYQLVANGETALSPIDYRASVIVGWLCLFACVMLFLFYIIDQHRRFSIKKFLLDFAVLLVVFYPFYLLWDILYRLLSHII